MATHKLVSSRDEVRNGQTVKVEVRERRDGSRFEAVVQGGFLNYWREVDPAPEGDDAEG